MLSIIAADNPSLAAHLQRTLVRCGCDCPPGNVVATDFAPQFLAGRERSVDALFVILGTDIEGTLKTLQQLRGATRAKLVAVGPTHDPRLILRTVHSGADDYVDAEGSLDVELPALLKRLHSNQKSAAGPGRLIVVTGASGGSGRSLLAVNLAALLAQRIGHCGLCDFDLRSGDLAALLNLRPRHTVAHLCRDLAKLDQAMFERSLLDDPSGIRLLAAPELLSEVDQLDFRGVPHLLKLARQTLPYVVVDVEHYLRKESLQTMQLADAVLVVLRLDFVSLRDTRRLLEAMLEFGISADSIQLVANRCDVTHDLSTVKAQAALGRPLRHVLPDDPQAALVSFNTGRPAALDSSNSRLAKALVKLTDDVLTQFPPAGGWAAAAPEAAAARAGALASFANRIKAALT